ncbi:MAG TPA: hypothetical protein VHE54_10135 [Puia sp.]|nr:hypothetical protein [Puia sp.]
MKKINLPAITALAAIALVTLLSSCKKEIDYIGRHYNDLSPYRITKFSYTQPFGGTDTLTFSYDKWGNPTTVTRPVPRTGDPNFEFRYDRNHRLTDFIGIYSGATAGEFWHRYFYDQKGQITKDSLYVFPTIAGGQMTGFYYNRLIQLSYDHYGRIIQEINALGANDTARYVYDATGNLAGRTYDNKVSFHQTNRIWMFLDRDYSLNNPFVAEHYNAAGLPLHIDLHSENTFTLKFLYDNYYNIADITYSLNKW